MVVYDFKRRSRSTFSRGEGAEGRNATEADVESGRQADLRYIFQAYEWVAHS